MAVIFNDFISSVQADIPRFETTVLPAEIETEDAVQALIDAGLAQSDATDALTATGTNATNLADPVYLSNRLSDGAAAIVANSSAFLTIGTAATGVTIGSAGIFCKVGGVTTFSIEDDGTANFKGDITGASGTFTGDITGASGTFSGTLDAVDGNFEGTISAGAVIIGGVAIGTSTGTAMIAATSTAQTTANTGVTNAATADSKAVAAQSTANSALSNVGSYSYLASVLDNASTQIKAASSTFILIGNTSTGLYLGSAGLYGKKSGATTFSIDSSGNAAFKGDISGASGTFTGQINTSGMLVSANASGDAVVIQNNSNLSAGLYIYGTGSTAMIVLSGVSNFKNATFDGSVQVNGQLRSYSSGDDDLGGSSYYWRNAYLTTAYISQLGKDLKSRTIRPDITGTGYECGIAASRWWKVNAQYGNFDYVNCATQVTVPLLTVTNDISVTDNITLSGKLLKSTWADGKIEVSLTNDGVADASYYYRFV